MDFLKYHLLNVIKEAKRVSPTCESCPLKAALEDLAFMADKVDYESFHGIVPKDDETQLAREIVQILGVKL